MSLEPARWGVWELQAALLPKVYLDAVVAAGGMPVLLPPAGIDASVLDVVDALIVAGGGDVDPAAYGAGSHPQTGGIDPRRDGSELLLVKAALERDLPLLAVCRGLQVLNVALGGSLIQHLPDVVGHDGHRPAPAVFGSTEVKIEAESLTGRLLGDSGLVPCYHHQGLDRVAERLTVTATAADGTVEAAEVEGRTFALGVQWHPEQDPSDLRLFEALVTRANF